MSAANNARWIGAIQLSKIGVQLLSLVVLSRLLQPTDFGLVALAAAVSTFALLFRDLGTAPAIIQKPSLDEPTKAAAFWLNAAFGLALGVAIVVIAPLVARLMDAPRVTGVLMVLAVTFPIAGLSIVHQALLERASRFAVIARIEITSLVLGFAVAVTTALAGAGPYSLVFQTVTVAVFTTIQLFLFAPWKPSGPISLERVRDLWGFSRDMLGFNLLNYFARNADALIIGKFLGPASLGIYSLAYKTMLFPLHNLTFVATRALLPVMSRQQSDVQNIASMYLRSVSVITFFTAPLMVGLFVLREPFVDAVFGPTWHAVADVIAWLAPIGFIQSVVSASGTVFMTLGRTRTMLRVSVIASTLHVIGFFIGVRWGITGVAACYLATNALVAVPILAIVMKCLHSGLRDLLRAAQRPILLSLAMGVVLVAARSEIAALDVPLLVQLSALAATGSLLYFTLVHFAASALERDVFRALLKKA
jgi:O-antigen/teichoic acid export membrane protein